MSRSNTIIDQERRLELYFIHSDRFLFGLKELGQREIYRWLEHKGFVDNQGRRYKGSYRDVEIQMIDNQGIKRIFEELVIPTALDEFGAKSIEYLRKCWWDNRLPSVEELNNRNIVYRKNQYGGCSFLETRSVPQKNEGLRTIKTDTQVVGWTDWAKLYFIEIDYLDWYSEDDMDLSLNLFDKIMLSLPEQTKNTINKLPEDSRLDVAIEFYKVINPEGYYGDFKNEIKIQLPKLIDKLAKEHLVELKGKTFIIGFSNDDMTIPSLEITDS